MPKDYQSYSKGSLWVKTYANMWEIWSEEISFHQPHSAGKEELYRSQGSADIYWAGDSSECNFPWVHEMVLEIKISKALFDWKYGQ